MADINVFGIYEPLLDAGGALTELRQQVVTNYSPALPYIRVASLLLQRPVTLPILLTMKYPRRKKAIPL